MPKLDQTGPQGKGPGTGRGLGRCQNSNAQTKENFPGFGRTPRQNEDCRRGLRQNRRNTPLRNQAGENVSK